MRRHSDKTRGFAIIELMITMLVLVLIVQAFTVFMQNVQTKNINYRDRAFATQKAVQMLEELRGVVATETGAGSVDVLDSYDDRGFYKFTLTTETGVTGSASDHQTGLDALSGNPVVSGEYKFVRQVRVLKSPTDETTRKVWVRVYYAADNNGATSLSLATPKDPNLPPLAEVFTIIQTVGTDEPPTQVMDVFLVAIENVPGWWVRPSDLRPMVATSLNNLQARNPGLRIRERWISRLSYGRDPEYSPEINTEEITADNGSAFSGVYIYPGWTAYDDTDNYYMDPYWFKGRIHTRGAGGSDSMWLNHNYPLADQFNHAVRYEEEIEMHALLSQGATRPPEISLRMLLEGMNRGDPAYVNSIILNLHGEMVPLVPLRNYSDAAKDPAEFWSGSTPKAYRAVSHFEKLHFDSSSDEIALRVYAYNAHPANSVEGDSVDVSLFVPNALAANIDKIERLLGSSTQAYRWEDVSYAVDENNLPTGIPNVFEVTELSTLAGDQRNGVRVRLFGVSTTARQCVDCIP